jgi:hypothetical protein
VARTETNPELFWRLVLVILGAWSVLPPYIGPGLGMELDVSDSVEFVDHAIPGALVVVSGIVSAMVVREGGAGSLADVIALGVCCLAGFRQTATHFSLWLDAGDPARPWDAVILHATAGPAIAILAAWLLLRAPEVAGQRGSEP